MRSSRPTGAAASPRGTLVPSDSTDGRAADAIGGPVDASSRPTARARRRTLRRRVFCRRDRSRSSRPSACAATARRVLVSISAGGAERRARQVIGVTDDRPRHHRPRPRRRRAARHAALVEHSADAIVAVDLEGRITSWNHAATALYGHTEREALGRLAPMTWSRAPTASRGRPGSWRARSSGASPRAGAATGRRSSIASTLSPIRDRSGRVTGAVGRLARRDATSAGPRRRCSVAQMRFQAAFEHAPIGMALIALDDVSVAQANTALCEMFGYEDLDRAADPQRLLLHEDRAASRSAPSRTCSRARRGSSPASTATSTARATSCMPTCARRRSTTPTAAT